MTRLSRIRIGMTVLDRTGTIIGVVKALELTKGIKPSPNLILDDGARSRQLLEAGAKTAHRATPTVRKGYLVIAADAEEDVVESLESIGRVAGTSVHLSVSRRIDPIEQTCGGSLAEV